MFHLLVLSFLASFSAAAVLGTDHNSFADSISISKFDNRGDINGQFSGSLFIYNGACQGSACPPSSGSNQCPASAPVTCSSIGCPDWCCPAGHSCISTAVSNSNSGIIVGCCPSGYSQCSGSFSVTTVTVAPVVTAAQPQPTTLKPGPVTSKPEDVDPNAPYCTTLIMAGQGLPTTRNTGCGKTLILSSSAPKTAIALWYLGTVGVILSAALMRMFG